MGVGRVWSIGSRALLAALDPRPLGSGTALRRAVLLPRRASVPLLTPGSDDRDPRVQGVRASSAVPVCVDQWRKPLGKTIIWIGAGDFFTIALTCNGQVLVVGANDECQCGVAYKSRIAKPTPLQGVPAALAIACGGAHCVMVVQRNHMNHAEAGAAERPVTVDAEEEKRRLRAMKRAKPPKAELPALSPKQKAAATASTTGGSQLELFDIQVVHRHHRHHHRYHRQ